jgi:hypothetical protein
MSRAILHPAVPLGAARPRQQGLDALESRLRLVLETRPGRLPWRPDFGCDLVNLQGEPATPANLSRAAFVVEVALQRWLPDVKVQRCEVRADPLPSPHGRDPSTPAGEGALLSLGVHAELRVELDLFTALGPLHVSAAVTP